MANWETTTEGNTGARVMNFYIRIPYNSNITSITNRVVKNTSFPFHLVSYADEIEEIDAYGNFENYLKEINVRKDKNFDAIRKYEKDHDEWNSKHEIHMFGVSEHMAKEWEREWLEKNPEPQPPVLLNEKVQEKAKQKSARFFFFSVDHYSYSKKEYNEMHEKIGKFVLDLSMFLIEKVRVKEGLLSFTITGDHLSYKIENGSCVIDHLKIESIERLKKINEGLISDIKQLEWKVKFSSDSEASLSDQLKLVEENRERVERESNVFMDKEQTIRRFVTLGMNDTDVERTLGKVKECLESFGQANEQIEEEIKMMKEVLGRKME